MEPQRDPGRRHRDLSVTATEAPRPTLIMATKSTPQSKPATAKKPAPATAKAKDLPAKKNAKGGALSLNRNETLLGGSAI